MTNKRSTTGVPMSYRWSAYVTPKSPKGWSKAIFCFLFVIALVFSKAFDSVRHNSVVSKLANFTLSDYLHKWIANNLSGRQHKTKLDGSVSPILPINASIIQGSAVGPAEYVLTASDLHLIFTSPANLLCKYADDTYLLVPATNSSSILLVYRP